MPIILVSVVLFFFTSCEQPLAAIPTVTENGRVKTKQTPSQKPSGSNKSDIRFVWVIPNQDVEVFSIGNFGTTPVNMTGWVLKDIKSWTWKLDSLGNLPARTQRILYSDQRQLVNNTGDTLFLLNAERDTIHRFGFGASQRGDTIKAP